MYLSYVSGIIVIAPRSELWVSCQIYKGKGNTILVITQS